MRLNAESAATLPAEIERHAYDRDGQDIGIVHFGIGAFHRAHMAWYTDLAMDAGERGWLISGISLRTTSVAEQLNPQDGLYTLTTRSGTDQQTRLIGSVREVLFAPECREAVIDRVASPECRIVSFTVTEKGYARGGGGRLDFAAAADSFYPYLADALAARCGRGLPGVTLLCCDNLPNNGKVLERLLCEWIAEMRPELSRWFAENCTAPSTMIDRIVPRTTPSDLEQIGQALGVVDEGAVFTERFSQWVIEDNFAGPRPAWEKFGAQLVQDVAPYETAKLRMLNGAHSLLAYCGLRAGHEFVHEAIADPALRQLAERLMRQEAAPTIEVAAGQDLEAYADELLVRFSDPALRHRLAQIAMDGTQKIPQRWLDTALALRRNGQPAPAIAAGLEAWLWHLEDGRFVDDPFGDELCRLAHSGDGQAVHARCFLGDRQTPALWPGYGELVDSVGLGGVPGPK